MTQRQYDPDELGALASADLKAATSTIYLSPVIPVGRGFAFLWNVDVLGDATTGEFSLTVQVMKNNQIDVLFEKLFATGISSAGGGGKVSHQALFGGGVDCILESPSGQPEANVNIIKLARFYRLKLVVTTQATDGASATAVSTLIIEESRGRSPGSS